MNPLLETEHLVLALAAILGVTGFAAWRSTAKCRRGIRFLVIAARILGVLSLALIAINPGKWMERSKDRGREWAILIDRSASMSVTDVDGRTRWEKACSVAEDALAASDERTEARLYAFADQPEAVAIEDLKGLAPNGQTTDIVRAGKSVLDRSRSSGKHLVGIILVSDGRQIVRDSRNDLGIRARSQETPIYVVPLGGKVQRKDLSIRSDRHQYVAFVGQSLKITAVVMNKGLGKIAVPVSLARSDGTEIGTQKVNIDNDERASAQFEIIPPEEGYYEYVVTVPQWPGDTTPNNEAHFGVAVIESKMRVFMAEGRPSWDSKFVAQLLRKQPHMLVTSVYRLSADRFLKVETDTSETSGATKAIFPNTETEISSYDLIVLGKGMEYFLTPQRTRLLRKFVRDQGGCIIFARGKPYNGELPMIESLEPVVWGKPLNDKFRFIPTAAGEDIGLFGGALPGPGDSVWQTIPELQYARRCASLRSFAQVLAEGKLRSAGREFTVPLVVSRRYGKGLTVVVNIEGLWQWGFFPSAEGASMIYQQFWTQLIQWAATYAEFLPGSEYSLRLSDSSVMPDTPVLIRIGRRDAKSMTSPPSVRVFKGSSVVQTVSSSPSGADGQWDAVVSLSEPGKYRLELTAEQTTGSTTPCAALLVTPPPSEQDDYSSDPEFLTGIATASGGAAIRPEDVADTVKSLVSADEEIDMTKAVWDPYWDRWWFLAAVLLFFAFEWFVRRRNGLL